MDTNTSPNTNTVFADESAMLRQLEAMGMPRQMLANLTPQQKQAMLAMTQSPEIQQRAQERVAHEEDWKQEKDYLWKNTRDDVFLKQPLGSATTNVVCDIQTNHLKISVDGNVVVDRELFQAVQTAECQWEIQGDTLVVSLRKAQAPLRWLTLYR